MNGGEEEQIGERGRKMGERKQKWRRKQKWLERKKNGREGAKIVGT